MEAHIPAVDAVVDEIHSYRRGFGDASRIIALLRESVVLLPLDSGRMPFTSVVRGFAWLPIFTGIDEYSTYLEARQQQLGDYQAIRGDVLIDEVLPRFGSGVGLVINAAGDAPFAFPADALRVDND